MSDLKKIREKIDSINSLTKITRVVQMVSTIGNFKNSSGFQNIKKFTQYTNDSLKHANRFYQNNFIANSGGMLFKNNSNQNKKTILMISSNKGMCGSLNNDIVRNVVKKIEATDSKFSFDILCFGSRGYAILKSKSQAINHRVSSVKVLNEFQDGVFQNQQVQDTIDGLIKDYLTNNTSELLLFFASFKSLLSQVSTSTSILPINHNINNNENDSVVFDIDQNTADSIIKMKINCDINNAITDCCFAMNAARVNAMNNATKNAEECMHLLKNTYNKKRQYKITSELIDIVSGFNAV